MIRGTNDQRKRELRQVPTHMFVLEMRLRFVTVLKQPLPLRVPLGGFSQVRDRHYDMGALLLGLGTFAAIEGPVNTFLRAQKLFPGAHLYAGAGIVVSWAVAASLVPQMQKGNETARVAHMAINFGMIGLFAWQV